MNDTEGVCRTLSKDVNTINEHFKNLYSDYELPETAYVRKNRIVHLEGNRQLERIRALKTPVS
ncbi:hypothetical protein ACKXGF_14030 [Alkalibacillus sp. S2W]|uniref:hypothetical protein n=1 Tax=Alkalibacillus sp. S2W TaxID=3386553 RepID=UPI00398D3437